MRESGSGNSIAYTTWDVLHGPPVRGWAIISSAFRPRSVHFQVTVARDAGDSGNARISSGSVTRLVGFTKDVADKEQTTSRRLFWRKR